jgi:hypothetical protein
MRRLRTVLAYLMLATMSAAGLAACSDMGGGSNSSSGSSGGSSSGGY